MADIKAELESNELLANDLGPFKETSDQWGAYALTFKDYDARIMCVSTETAVRGIKFKEYRPDLIILDDIEDINSTRTKEARDKIHAWFTGEIIPLGDPATKIIVLGNFLHEYSLVGRLRSEIQSGKRSGVFKCYPLVDDDGNCLWPGMYPTPEAVETQRRKINDEPTWQREYCLKIMESDARLITLEQMHFYDKVPPKDQYHGYLYTWIGTDFAVGQNDWNDFTAVVTFQVHHFRGKLQIYVLPDIINKRLDFDQAIAAMQQILDTVGEPEKTKMILETNGIQLAYYQHMLGKGYHQVVPVKSSNDKLFRIQPVINLIKTGEILLPRTGAQELIYQLLDFHNTIHEDLCDATSIAIGRIIEDITTNNRGQRPQSYYYGGKDGPYVSEDRIARLKAGKLEFPIHKEEDWVKLRPWQTHHLNSIPEYQKISKCSINYAHMQESFCSLKQKIYDRWYYYDNLEMYSVGDHTVGLEDVEAPRLYILMDLKYFPKYLPSLMDLFGQPFEQDEGMVTWNVQQFYPSEHVIELYLVGKDCKEALTIARFYSELGRRHYFNVSQTDGSLRDYVKRKFEFMNKTLAARPLSF